MKKNKYRIDKTQLYTTTESLSLEVVDSITNSGELHKAIVKAESSPELIKPALKLAELTQAYKKADQELKSAIKEKTEKAKEIKKAIDEMTVYLKESALNVVKIEKTQYTDTSGEVKFKIKHDLPTKLFSYQAGKTESGIDYRYMVENPKKYSYYLKPTAWEIDLEKIHEEKDRSKFPWKEQDQPAKVIFKTKLDKKDIKALIETADAE